MARRLRADQALVERGLAESRTRAQALILAGKVFSRERRVEKPGETLAPDAALEVRGQDHPWVSRGGLKLAHALAHFALSPAGRVGLDIGASTGGFTDVLLARRRRARACGGCRARAARLEAAHRPARASCMSA